MRAFQRTLIGTLLVAVALAPYCANASESSPLALVSVEAGDRDRMDTPVAVTLPQTLRAFGDLCLIETTNASRTLVPLQIEASEPPKLWFVLRGKTKANSARRFELCRGPGITTAGVRMQLTPKTLDVTMGGERLFSYNHRHVVPPKGIKPDYIRSGYIHPMFSPSGELVTEDFPDDHLHHKGIWFPWTKTEFDGHEVDFWNLGKNQGTVQFAGFEGFENGPVYARFRAKHQFVDLTQGPSGKVALNEIWDVRVWNVGGPAPSGKGYWLWDITSQQSCASDSPLHLKAYRYGGFAFRGAEEWDGDNYVLLTSEGKTKENGHTTRAKWCAHSGAVEEKWSTVVILCHPKNERFPEPMRIWAKGGAFFNYTPIQQQPLDLKPGEVHRFRYRLFVHTGPIDKAAAESVWQDFAAPPVATLKVVGS